MVTTKEEHNCTHPDYLRFIQDFDAWGRQKKLVMCRGCGKLVKTIKPKKK